MSAIMQKQPNVTPELDQLCINTIRALAIDAVQKAESGHPGLPLGAAPMAYVLWTRFMSFNPKNPKWENRDRFLAAGGEQFQYVPALNARVEHARFLADLIARHCQGWTHAGHGRLPSAARGASA